MFISGMQDKEENMEVNVMLYPCIFLFLQLVLYVGI